MFARGDNEKDLPQWTLREIIEARHVLVIECTYCHRLCSQDAWELVEKFGPNATLAQLLAKFGCRKCKRKRAQALLRTGSRKDDWWPCRPGASR